MRHTVLVKPVFSKKATAPTGHNAVLLGVAQAIISWTNPPATLYDYLQIEHDLGLGAGYVFLENKLKGASNTADAQGYSLDTTWRITAKKAGWSDAVQKVTNTVRSLPFPPSYTYFGRQSPNNPPISLYWLDPTQAHLASFEIWLSTDNGASWTGAGGPWTVGVGVGFIQWALSYGAAQYKARIRTLDTFGQYSTYTTTVMIL